MKKLYGKPLADKMLVDTRALIGTLKHRPLIKVVCNDRNQPYYKGIAKDAAYCGIDIAEKRTWSSQLDGIISLDPNTTPPEHINLDGGNVTPCTAEAIVLLLDYYNIPIAGKNICVVGRSPRVGRPLVDLLIDRDATVTICHSKTDEKTLYWNFMNSDIIISCVGKAMFDGRLSITQYATVVDVGDDFLDYGQCNSLIPFIGGVGPVTRAVLMRHVYEKAREKEREREL